MGDKIQNELNTKITKRRIYEKKTQMKITFSMSMIYNIEIVRVKKNNNNRTIFFFVFPFS